MFLAMGVGLYTSRVVLNTLGVEDYGVYNIVGGIVVIFSFFNSAMSSATQRFLSFDLGSKDFVQLKKTFSTTLNIHFFVALVFLILAESVGLWFVNYKLNLPEERMYAVNWVYQFSVFTFLFGIIQVPYNALIIARERMNIYAYISIFEVIFKLIIVYLLVILDFDKLILYSALLFGIAFFVRFFEKSYCKKHFEESKYEFYYDKSYTKTLLAYSGWNIFGNVASIARSQGSNILLNIFFGTVLNASYGIALQVQGVVNTFVTNIQMAVNPQITKKYAAGNSKESIQLIVQTSKFSYFLMSLLVFPILFNTKYLIESWLRTVPEHTIIFIKLSLIGILIDTISGPLMTGIQATGNIKYYQIVVGSLVFLNLPLSYVGIITFKFPEIIFYTSILISCLSLLFRIYFLNKTMEFNVLYYVKNVIFKILLITAAIVILLNIVQDLNIIQFDGFKEFLSKSILTTLFLIILIYTIGLAKNEKRILSNYLHTLKINK